MSLVEDYKFEMHRDLRDMGRYIVIEKYEELGEHNNLWTGCDGRKGEDLEFIRSSVFSPTYFCMYSWLIQRQFWKHKISLSSICMCSYIPTHNQLV